MANPSTEKFTFGELFKVQGDIMDQCTYSIENNGHLYKSNVHEIIEAHLELSKIDWMPYGHAIASEVTEELSLMYIATANCFTFTS